MLEVTRGSRESVGNLANASSLPSPNLDSGFTILELLIAVAIAAILLTIAVPSMQQFLDNQSIRAACSNVSDGLRYARAEAIRRSAGSNSLVILGPACSSNYNNGWYVFQDAAGSAADFCYSGTDTLLQRFDAPSRSATVTFGKDAGSEDVKYVGFNGQGLTRGGATGGFVAGTFTCSIATSAAPKIDVVINALGRARQTAN